jgi:fido (protein-threonine AMPylation protein)
LHHRLALIHPFPNGNGRHARLLADVLIRKLGGTAFSWGSKDLVRQGTVRTAYLDAMKAADMGEIEPLLVFARS